MRKVLAVITVIGILLFVGSTLFPHRQQSLEEANAIAVGQGFVLFITIICGIAYVIIAIVSFVKRKGKSGRMTATNEQNFRSKEEELNEFLKDFNAGNIPLPRIWVGYILAFLFVFFSVGAIPLIDDWIHGNFPSSSIVPIAKPVLAIFFVTAIGSIVFWFYYVHRIHRLLKQMSNDAYPIGPWRSILGHLIPIYNYYWLIKWPKEVTIFTNYKWAELVEHLDHSTVERKKTNIFTVGLIFLLIALLHSIFVLPMVSVGAWQEITVLSAFFLLIYYAPLHLLTSRVKKAFIIGKWIPSADTKT